MDRSELIKAAGFALVSVLILAVAALAFVHMDRLELIESVQAAVPALVFLLILAVAALAYRSVLGWIASSWAEREESPQQVPGSLEVRSSPLIMAGLLLLPGLIVAIALFWLLSRPGAGGEKSRLACEQSKQACNERVQQARTADEQVKALQLCVQAFKDSGCR